MRLFDMQELTSTQLLHTTKYFVQQPFCFTHFYAMVRYQFHLYTEFRKETVKNWTRYWTYIIV